MRLKFNPTQHETPQRLLNNQGTQAARRTAGRPSRTRREIDAARTKIRASVEVLVSAPSESSGAQNGRSQIGRSSRAASREAVPLDSTNHKGKEMTNEHFAEAFESFIPASKDTKGRVFGYVVGLREVIGSGECYAWVQKSVLTSEGWKDWGATQRSKKFPSLAAAKFWAYSTARARAAAN